MRADATTQQRLSTLLFYAIVIALGYLTLRILEPFLVALAWAAVLVVVAYPIYTRLTERWRPTWAALATTAGVTFVLIVPALAALYAAIQQGIGAVHTIQVSAASGHFDWASRAWMDVQRRFPELGSASLGDTLRGYAELAARFAAGKMGTILSNAFTFLFHLAVTILAMFYLFRDGQSVITRVRNLLPFEKEYADRMLHETQELIFASVVSSAAGAAANGVLGGIAFASTGITAPIFWGAMMGVFSLVPLAGSALIWLPAAFGLMMAGHVTRGVILIVLCVAIVSCVDNILRPWLISGRAEMAGLIVFISVLGGVEAFGMLGVVLGPIIVAALASLLDLYSPETATGNTKVKLGGKRLRGVLE